jgi:cellulose synthase A
VLPTPTVRAHPFLVSLLCSLCSTFAHFRSTPLFQAQKWSPITRETYLDRLELKYDHMGEASELAGVDVFVSTADPEKEPPLVTANVILSVLAADYPTDK